MPRSPFPDLWSAPPAGTIKVNFDAAFFADSHFQVAAVARDAGGMSVRRFLGCPSIVAGEARAELHAISLARDSGWTSLVIKGDSLQVIQAIPDGDTSLLTDAGLFLKDVLSSFSCTFVKRSSNSLAHALAHWLLAPSFVVEGVLLALAMWNLFKWVAVEFEPKIFD